MSYELTIGADAITLRLELKTVILMVKGQAVGLQKLPYPLAFARKPGNLAEVAGGELCDVYVFRRIEMAPLGFDAFARNLLRDTDWLEGLCMAMPLARARACVMVHAQGRPVLFVDTQGSAYARYVARLG